MIYSIACINYKETFKEIYVKHNKENILDKSFEALKKGTFNELKKYGSSHEAFPQEQSFCVTGTLLHDLISALSISNQISSLSEKETKILKNTSEFVAKNIESHANIGNHLLASLAGLIKFSKYLETDNKIVLKGISDISEKLEKIWHEEGWLEEYGGADIGYLSLSLQYLFEIDEVYFPKRNSWINSIMKFITNFFHLDGSIGNYYGSRGSSLIYPAAFLQSEEKNIFNFYIESFEGKKIPNHNDLDDSNFVPFINSLITGLVKASEPNSERITLPIHKEKYIKLFKEAGFLIVINNNSQKILDLNMSGQEAHFTESSGFRTGVFTIQKSNNKIFCALNSKFSINENDSRITISLFSKFYEVNTKPLNSKELIGSRLLIPIFNLFPSVLKIVKNIAVKKFFLLGKPVGEYKKVIEVFDYEISQEEIASYPNSFKKVDKFIHHPIKMASQNYIN